MNYKVLVAALLAAAVVEANALDPSMPAPWFKNGGGAAADSCKAGVDADLEAQGTGNLTLKCDEATEGFVSVMQNFSADHFLGKRIRFSALIKAEGVDEGAGLWMRVDDKNNPGASFDNMFDRAIKGSSDWTPYSIVLDSSPDAQEISIGALLSGKGQIWVRDLQFDVVAEDVATTVSAPAKKPGNLELAR
jgi:hypothetical protein